MSVFGVKAYEPGARGTVLSRSLLVLTAVLALLLAGCSKSTGVAPSTSPPVSAAPSGNTATVKTSGLTFMPDSLTVPAGTTVTWEDTDGIPHTVTTGTYTVDSSGVRTSQTPDGMINKPLTTGQNVTFTFDKPGTYTYYCAIHPGMNAKIIVTAK